MTRPDGGEFFARNGILFESVDDVRSDMAQLIKAEPFLGTLAADPTLHGVLGAISQSIEGVRLGKTTLEGMRPAVTAIADALDGVGARKASGLFLAPADHGPCAGALRASAVRQHPADPQLRRFAAWRPGDQGHPGDDRRDWA